MDNPFTYLKVMGSLILVILVAYGSLRYLLPFLQGGMTNQHNLEIIERLAVAPRASLCIIKAGSRYFLIGLTPAKIVYLNEIAGDDLVWQNKETTATRFAEILQSQKKKISFPWGEADDKEHE